MKKIWIGTILGLLVFASCADKKENREEFKADHKTDATRDDMSHSAVANSKQNSADTTNLAKDTIKKPTDYESKESRPNTQVGGSR